MIQIHVKMQEALQQSQQLYTNFKNELEALPIGSLYTKKRKNQTYYYHTFRNSQKKTHVYLDPSTQSGASMLQKLFRQRFLRNSLPILENNIATLSCALKKFQRYDPNDVLEGLPPAYQEIAKGPDLWLSQQSELKTWENEFHLRNTAYPQRLAHETACGIFVRSKAESMILDMLNQFQIPCRYEPLITANQKTYSPDFVILRPRDHETMYWEHFGQMDNPDYAAKNALKLMDYQKAGINVNRNLIITMETKEQPLTSKEILNTITNRLL